MRTLVVSDLHLGARLRRDVLSRGEALEALLDSLAGIDRLVLLGDVVELLEGRPAQAMEVAEPVLRAIGGRLSSETEVIVVPGNHDGELIAPWLRAHGVGPAVDAELPGDATPVLARVVACLLARAPCACATRASGCPTGSGRRTATTSTGTCCRRPPSGSPAACSGACRATAPGRSTTSAPAALP